MKLDTNAHSVFLLHYHLILVVKYRRQVFTDEISERAKEIFSYIGQPKTEMSKFINAYKSASSRLLKKEFPIIRQKLWKEMFWSQSFCLLSSGGAPIEVIKEYIENQGQKK